MGGGGVGCRKMGVVKGGEVGKLEDGWGGGVGSG